MNKQTPNIIRLELIDSTNNFLKALKTQEQLPDFTYVQANFQTAGKGQRGNFWEAENNKNLLFSVLLRPTELPIAKHFILSEIVSLALIATLRQFSKEFKIKWPNDIYWKENKVAGILIENDLEGMQIKESVVGIGLNVNQVKFSPAVPNPTSIHSITYKEQNSDDILLEFHQHLERYLEMLKGKAYDKIAEEYQSLLFRAEGYHQFKDKEGVKFKAKIESVAHDGALNLVDDKDKKRTYLFKEVQFVI